MDISPERDASPLLPNASSGLRSARRVLLALGAEREAGRGVREAHAFARGLGAELHVIRVVPCVRDAALDGHLSLARALRESQDVVVAGRHTRAMCDRVLVERLPSQSICVRLGTFVAQVAERARQLDADIIAIPHRRRLGGVARHLALQTGRGVLVTRGSVSFATLLAATDLEDEGTPLLHGAARLGDTLNASVVALHGVIDDPAQGVGCAALDERREALERAALNVGPSIRSLVLRARSGAQCILEGARSNAADLIIVGARARSSAAATAARVIQRARRSVLVAPIDAGQHYLRGLAPHLG